MNLLRYLAVLAAAIIVPASNSSLSAQTPSMTVPLSSKFQSRPIKPYLDKHGHALRTPKNALITGNWSGYAVANFETGLYYSSASATWQVPKASWGLTTGSPSEEYNSIWVGIDGFCENASCSGIDSSTLIQLGTMQIVSQSGAVSNLVWYELYPAAAQQIAYPVNIGDVITASVECTANCSPGQTQTWLLSMTDHTLGWTWTQNFNSAGSMLSAEWIVEAPGSTLPLNNFTQANFDPIVANGSNPTVSETTNSIVAEDSYGQTSDPSGPNNGDWFGACWGYGSLTPCTAAGFGASAPTAALTASPSSISSGGSSTLAWDSTNATSCSGSGFSASGTSGSTAVQPTATTTYGVTCSGSGGSATARSTVQVDGPSASLTASPTSVSSGGSSTLSWNSSGAASCSGNGFAASGTSGSAVVYPSATTTYSVTCSGSSGSATADATIQIKTHGHRG
ncbi:MAG TPA: G1 family glutamic endopeptidase [Stellaceae bacterium]|nr:G1 family glutamic endopeptidase [Stellaceae bacterium]